MQTSETRRAVAAAMSSAAAQGLRVEDANVLNDSNRLVLRLMPCDVVVRLAPMDYQASAELRACRVRPCLGGPEEVGERYPDADQELVGECRGASCWR